MKIKCPCPRTKFKGAPARSCDDVPATPEEPRNRVGRRGLPEYTESRPGTKGTQGSGKVGRKNVLEATLTPKTEPALGQSLVFCRGGRAGREEERAASHRLVPAVRGSEPP